MDSQKTTAFINAQCAFFEDGDVEHLVSYYRAPIALYVGDQLQVFSTLPDFLDNAVQWRETYRKHGILGLSGSVSAIELVRNRQFRLWIDWNYHLADRVRFGATEAIYYCNEVATGLEVQMIQRNRADVQDMTAENAPAAITRPAHG